MLVAAGMEAAMASTVASVATVAGTAMQFMGAMSQADSMRATAARNAENARISAEANKKQLDYAAGQADASGQHAAEKERQKAALMLARAQAVAAHGGGGLDESIYAGILGAGEKAAGGAMYESGERSAGLRYRGDVGSYEANARGINEIKSANSKADATMLGAIGNAGMTIAGRFGGAGAPGVETIGDTTYYGGAGPDRNWGYGD
jgi:hypothetical protein